VSPRLLFRTVAVLEACSWVGLLIGMYLKRVAETTDVGVQVMGPIHGVAFILYVGVTLVVSREAGWSKGRVVLGLVSSIPPLMTVWFDRWAERRDLLPDAWQRTASDA
jgi:integral membrane protein